MAVLPPDPLFRFRAEMGHLHCLCFVEEDLSDIASGGGDLKNPNLLMAAGEEGIVYFWDLEKNRLKFKQELGNSIQALHCYKSNVIIQEKEGLITMFKPKEELVDQHPVYERHTSTPCASGFCKSIRLGELLIIPQENATVQVFDLNNLTTVKSLQVGECSKCECKHADLKSFGQLMCIEQALITTSGGPKLFIFAGFETGDIFVWNYDTGEQVAHAKFFECLMSLSVDGFGMRGICGGAGQQLQVFTIDKQLQMKIGCEVTLTNEGCQVVKVRKDRKIVVSGGLDGRLRIYSWKTLRLFAVLSENHARITDVQFTIGDVKYWGSRIMAVAGADGTITLWNLYNN